MGPKSVSETNINFLEKWRKYFSGSKGKKLTNVSLFNRLDSRPAGRFLSQRPQCSFPVGAKSLSVPLGEALPRRGEVPSVGGGRNRAV